MRTLHQSSPRRDLEDSDISVMNTKMPGQFEIEKEVLLKLLKSVKVDKSPVSDGIYPRLLREAGEEIAGALKRIFVSSLAKGKVLEEW